MTSVIICTYNRAPSLLRVLHSLAAMIVPDDLEWEILVIDNNSRDATKAVVTDFAPNTKLNIRYVFEGNQGLNHARNTGVMEALGEIVSFIDDDVVVAENWIGEIREAFNTYSVVCVGGRVLLQPGIRKPDWWDGLYDDALGKFDNGGTIFLPDEYYTSIVGIGANLSFKRSVFHTYGLFRPELDRHGRKLLMGGEIEFYDRLRGNGEATMYYPHAVVYHCPDMERLTRQYLRRWYFRIGEWNGLRENSRATKGVPSLLGIPRWRCRLALEHCLRTVRLSLRLRRKEAFVSELQFLTALGSLYGAMKRAGRVYE